MSTRRRAFNQTRDWTADSGQAKPWLAVGIGGAGLYAAFFLGELRGFVFPGYPWLVAAFAVAIGGFAWSFWSIRRMFRTSFDLSDLPDTPTVLATGWAVRLSWIALILTLPLAMFVGSSWWSGVRMGSVVAHSIVERAHVSPHSKGPADVQVTFTVQGERVTAHLADPEQDDSFYVPGVDLVYVPGSPTHVMAYADYRSSREPSQGWLLLGSLAGVLAMGVWARSSIRRRRELLLDGRPTVALARLRYVVNRRGTDFVRVEWTDGVKGAYAADEPARSMLEALVARRPGVDIDDATRAFLADRELADDDDDEADEEDAAKSDGLSAPEDR